MTGKHTPGPWHRNIPPARKYPTVWAGRNTHVAAVVPGAPWGSGNGATMSDEEIEANINLIAAVPELYEALALVAEVYQLYDVEAVAKALAKASGEDLRAQENPRKEREGR